MPSAHPRDSKEPHCALAVEVIVRAVSDHHWRWFVGTWEPTPSRPEGTGTAEFWCDVAGLDYEAVLQHVSPLYWEWLWDLAAWAIRKDMEERA